MIKYNRDKRGAYKSHIRRARINGTCDTHDKRTRIHIPIHYDGYDRIEYIPIIYTKTRNNKAQIYVNTTNTITDIFPEINAPHTKHIYRANAPYRKFIPQATNYTRPEPDIYTVTEDTRTVKCIIINDNEQILYIGMMRRTRTVNVTEGKIHITLRRNDREMRAYERAISPDRIIHGITVREIKAHDVEIYYI